MLKRTERLKLAEHRQAIPRLPARTTVSSLTVTAGENPRICWARTAPQKAPLIEDHLMGVHPAGTRALLPGTGSTDIAGSGASREAGYRHVFSISRYLKHGL